MTKLKVLIFYGSTRPSRQGIKLVRFLKEKMENLNLDVTVFDAKEMSLPLLQNPIHFYKDKSQIPAQLLQCNQQILDSDGFILVNGEYNRTIQPGLTNMLDHFPPSSFSRRPAAIASYSMGRFAAAVSSSHLRDVIAELNMYGLHKSLHIPEIGKEISEEGITTNERFQTTCDSMLSELIWLCEAVKSKKSLA